MSTHTPHMLSDGKDARSTLVEANLPLARSLAHQFVGRGLDFEDLCQEACIGVIRAAETFDETRGTRFSTHATWCIRSALWRALEQQSRLIRVPAYLFYERAITTLSLDAPLLEDNTWCLADVLKDPTAPDPVQIVELEETTASLQALVEYLTPRQQIVLRLRYGIGGGQSRTLAEVGRLLGVTRQCVQQVEVRACRKLRTILFTGNKPQQKKQGHCEKKHRRKKHERIGDRAQRKDISKQRSQSGKAKIAPSTRITYHLQPAFCSKQRCRKCRDGGTGHGPYWYEYQYVNGRTKRTYIGKQTPVGMHMN